MSKPTPGPWEVAQSSDPLCVQSHRGYAIADMAEWGSIEDPNEHAANARLIAAAPDLLQSLQQLLDANANSVLYSDGNWEQARAAIARATGGGK